MQGGCGGGGGVVLGAAQAFYRHVKGILKGGSNDTHTNTHSLHGEYMKGLMEIRGTKEVQGGSSDM